jgi:hypothetical protein
MKCCSEKNNSSLPATCPMRKLNFASFILSSRNRGGQRVCIQTVFRLTIPLQLTLASVDLAKDKKSARNMIDRFLSLSFNSDTPADAFISLQNSELN